MILTKYVNHALFYRLSKMHKFFGTIKQYKMHDIGEGRFYSIIKLGTKEAIVQKWHVKIGDHVEEVNFKLNLIPKYKTVATVETGKNTVDIAAAYRGKIHKLFHKESDSCLVGEVFYEIEVDDNFKEEVHVKAEEIEPETKKFIENLDNNPDKPLKGALASPAVKAYAKELNIDLKVLTGTGPRGSVTRQDIEDYQVSLQLQQASLKQQKVKKINTISIIDSQGAPGYSKPLDKVIKMSQVQQVMSRTMVQSNTIPTFYLQDEYDITELSALRQRLNDMSTTDAKLSWLSFFVKAFSLSLLEYPIVNSSFANELDNEYIIHGAHNITLAVDSVAGLFIPNIKNVQDLNIVQIQAQLDYLKNKAENQKLEKQDQTGGTITISNIGSIGGTSASPLILPPQVCIVALGKTQIMPRYIGDTIQPRKMMSVQYGMDHRVLDGATAARFNKKVKQYLEIPGTMLLHMK